METIETLIKFGLPAIYGIGMICAFICVGLWMACMLGAKSEKSQLEIMDHEDN